MDLSPVARVNVLNQLVNQKKLSPAGRDWILLALDPFHDQKVHYEGYPDSHSALSNVQLLTSTTQLTFPGTSTGAWDCMITNMPMSSSTYCDAAGWGAYGDDQGACTAILAIDTKEVVPLLTLHPVTICSADAGETLWPHTSGWVPTNFESTGLPSVSVGNQYVPHRIIAWGYEIHNTTAEVYKQGTVTTGSVPVNPGLGERYFTDDSTEFFQASTVEHSSPPRLLSEAIQYPNARQWEAKDGVYVTCMIGGVENEVYPVQNRAFMTAENSARGINANGGLVTCPTWHELFTDNDVWLFPKWARNDYNMSFAYFTGLSHETTLTVTTKCYVEFFPMQDDALLPAATPSAPLDAKALALYSYAVNHLPPATKVGDNAKGTWFKWVSSILSEALPLVGLALDTVVPGAAVIGAAGGAAANAVGRGRSRRRNPPAAQRKKKIPNPGNQWG